MLDKHKGFFNPKNLALGLVLMALSSYVGKIGTVTIDQQLLIDTTFTGESNVDPLPQIQTDIKNGANVNIQDPVSGNTPLLNLLLTAQDGPVNFNYNYQTLLNDVNYLLSIPNINLSLTDNIQLFTPLSAAHQLWTYQYDIFASPPHNATDSEITASLPMINLTTIIQNIANATLLYNIETITNSVFMARTITEGAQLNFTDADGRTVLHHAILSKNSNYLPDGGTAYIDILNYFLFSLRSAGSNHGSYWITPATLNQADKYGMTALMYAAQAPNSLMDTNANGIQTPAALDAVSSPYGGLLQRPDIYVNQINPLDGNKTALDYAMVLINSSNITETQLTRLKAIAQAIATAGETSKVINANGDTSESTGLASKSNALGAVKAPVMQAKTKAAKSKTKTTTSQRKNKKVKTKTAVSAKVAANPKV